MSSSNNSQMKQSSSDLSDEDRFLPVELPYTIETIYDSEKNAIIINGNEKTLTISLDKSPITKSIMEKKQSFT